ncbi:hypothetical protein RDABS01_035899 [Bienertia sinuspersici]
MVTYVVVYTATMAAVTRFIEQKRNHVDKPKLYFHDDAYFTWYPKFNFHEEVLHTVPLWVKLPNLPLNCWTFYSLSRMGSALRVPGAGKVVSRKSRDLGKKPDSQIVSYNSYMEFIAEAEEEEGSADASGDLLVGEGSGRQLGPT